VPVNIPLYEQLAEELAASIRRGEFVAGSRLPTVRALAAERGVDINTVNRAYQLLAQGGVVEAHARRGTTVRAVAVPPAPVAAGTTEIRCAGSHDFCLDLLARQLRPAGVRLSLHTVGSVGGLTALAAGRAVLAGCHVLDADGRDFNHDAVARLLPRQSARLITLIEREQGLIVPRGNPRRLRDVADLAQPALRLINRQPGSGTRLLLDRLLAQAGVVGHDLAGYERIAETHLAVAAAVAAGSADAGLGIAAAARALDLDFVPLGHERYDLVLLADSLAQPWFGPLIETLAAPQFRAAAEALGGYDGTHTAWIQPAH
jgi:putative molybdopterin biosynthesis protein